MRSTHPNCVKIQIQQNPRDVFRVMILLEKRGWIFRQLMHKSIHPDIPASSISSSTRLLAHYALLSHSAYLPLESAANSILSPCTASRGSNTPIHLPNVLSLFSFFLFPPSPSPLSQICSFRNPRLQTDHPRSDGIDFPIPDSGLILNYRPRPFGEIPRNLTFASLALSAASAKHLISNLIDQLGPTADFRFGTYDPLGGVFLDEDVLIQFKVPEPGQAGPGGREATSVALDTGRTVLGGMLEALIERGWREEARIVARKDDGKGGGELLVNVELVFKQQETGEGSASVTVLKE